METSDKMSKACQEIRAELGVNYVDPDVVRKVAEREFVLSRDFPVAEMKKLLASGSSMLELFRSSHVDNPCDDLRIPSPVLMREKVTGDSDWEYFGWLSCYTEGCGFFAPCELQAAEPAYYRKSAFAVDEKTAVRLCIEWAQADEEQTNDIVANRACERWSARETD